MYDFKLVEEEVLKFWEENKTHSKLNKKNIKGKKFYFLQGPPYTSGKLHIGHAWNNTIKDLVLRYKRMNGFNVWDRAGYDMHGLPTENAVQKQLKIKDKLEIEKYGVEKFIKECIKFSSNNAKQMDKDLTRLGVWMDFENAYWPIKNEFIEGEWWLIKQAYNQNRLYKGKKIMHWCASCETSLAKHELEYKNLEDNSIFLKFKTKDDRFLLIWTTTPWTIPFNLAVMVNPDFDYSEVQVEKEKWIIATELVKPVMELFNKEYRILKTFSGKSLEGLDYKHPFESEINYKELKKKSKNVHTVILSKDYVTLEAGSGLVHCAPGCGPEDFDACKPYEIDAFNEIDEKGIFKNCGKFNGWKAKKDDKKFIEELDSLNTLVLQTPVSHEYATCWRCHNPVVFRSTEQWFLKIEDLIPNMLEFNNNVNWQPVYTKKNYDSWVENLKDNGISRQRYWGCPIPIWECSKCDNIEVISDSEEIKKLKGKVPVDLHKPWIDAVTLECPKCKSKMHRAKDVIDVWLDSGTTSWNCLYYPKKKELFHKYFPADFILEATEQIKLWFSMLQICSAVALGKSCYNNVYCHGMILDYQGTKMSKSLGNIISPYEVVDKYGADVLRYYMCQVPSGENINFSWEDVKIKQRNLNILYNLSKFISELKLQTKEDKSMDLEEEYIISRKNSTIKRVTELMEQYKIDEIIREIENLYLDLSRVYIQFTRDKVNSEPGKVLHTVNEVYKDVLKMFSIVCPFLTDKIWLELKEKDSVHLQSWPTFDEKKIDSKLEEEFKFVMQIIESGMKERNKVQIGLKWPLSKATVNSNKKLSKELQELVMRQLNIKRLEIKKGEFNLVFDTKLTKELEEEGFAREIARKVQDMRKTQNLKKQDKIKLAIITPVNLTKWSETISSKVGATSLDFKEKNYKIKEKVTIKDKEFTIFMEIIN